MSDDDFSELKNIKVPAANPAAREAALQASMLAFEQTKQKNSTQPQGLSSATRLTSIFTLNPWSWIMDHRVTVGTMVAALLVLPLAAQLMLTTNLTPLNWPKSEEKTDAGTTVVVSLPRNKDFDDRKIATGKNQQLKNALNESQDRTRASAAPSAESPLADVSPQPASPPVLTPPLRREIAKADGYAAAKSPPKIKLKKRMAVDGAISQLSAGSIVASSPVGVVTRERFEKFASGAAQSVVENPVSTFSIDVDTASYAFVRKSLEGGQLPSRDAVRVEEMINYFSYDYPYAETKGQPFKPTVAIYPTPWNSKTKLLHIGIKGYQIIPDTKPRSNLVFLIDVSGSMNERDKLPLLKNAFRLLVNQLDENDTVSIVTYAGHAGTVLEPTKVADRQKILAALDNLNSGGSTAGAQGIRQAYALAEQSFDSQGVNRVILATDGDFNVGIRGDELKQYIETKRKSGVFLSVLGFGRGNYNDALMQKLAQNGNGTAAYIDSLKEAYKVLVKEASSTLFPIAKDVKIQVEFNPKMVSDYRLIGYETRALKRADFNNDKVDAGDIGAGHTVTAIYEITTADSDTKLIDDLRYQKNRQSPETAKSFGGEYAFLKMRYKLPRENTSKLITVPITTAMGQDSIEALSKDMRFAASVAAFGQKLRGISYLEDFGYDDILKLAADGRGRDEYGYRAEFMSLVRLAKSLAGTSQQK